jgi:hypothetical protein
MQVRLYSEDFWERIKLNHLDRDGVWTHQCGRCGAEWPAERPDQPNPTWWRCPNGCNASACDAGFATGHD